MKDLPPEVDRDADELAAFENVGPEDRHRGEDRDRGVAPAAAPAGFLRRFLAMPGYGRPAENGSSANAVNVPPLPAARFPSLEWVLLT